MNVVYSGTRNLYPAMRGAIASLLDHNPDANVYVFAEDDHPDLPGTVINVSGQKYFPPDGPNMRSQFTYMAMIRVCTANHLPVDKVIQLDVDTIVCDSLEPLWETDLTGKWLGWCPEYHSNYRPYGKNYYNFGVAVMNLDQMRLDNMPWKAVQLLNTERLPYIDQDAMNLLAVPNKTVDIPVRFNESFCCGYTDNPAIVHYAGYQDWYTLTGKMPRWWLKEKYKKRVNA